MTIKEFYDWAIENNIENYYIAVQYRDGGGCYSGVDSNIECYTIEVDDEYKEVVL